MSKKGKKDPRLWPPLEFIEIPLDKTQNSNSCDLLERDSIPVPRITIDENATKWVTNQFIDFECRTIKKGRLASTMKENAVSRRKKTEKTESSFKSNKYVPLQVERKIHVPLKVQLEWSSILSDASNEKIGKEASKAARGSNRKSPNVTNSDSELSTSEEDERSVVILAPDTPESEYGLTLKMRQLREAKRRLF